MRAISRFTFLGFLSLLILSCTSIPLSTMIEFAGYSEQDVIKLDPNEIKIKVELNGGNNLLNFDDTKFEVKTNSKKGITAHHFALQLVSKKEIAAELHWYGDTQEKLSYILELTEESKAEFSKIQTLLRGKRARFEALNTHVVISIDNDSSSLSEEVNPLILVFSTYILLDETRGFIVLLDEAKVDFAKGTTE